MKWIARNLPLTLACIVLAGIFYIGLDALIDNKQYRKDIEILDNDIAKNEEKIKIIEGINSDLMDERAKAKAASDKKIADMKKNQKKELARINRKLDKWKAKVEEMPASTVVIKIRTILNLKEKEIVERPDGILFSLVAARDCLAVLRGFSFIERKRDQWKADYFEAMDRIKEKDDIIATDEFIFYNFDAICFTKDGIIEDEREKFSLSEGRNRVMYWKGIKHGSPIGGLIGLLIGLVLGK